MLATAPTHAGAVGGGALGRPGAAVPSKQLCPSQPDGAFVPRHHDAERPVGVKDGQLF